MPTATDTMDKPGDSLACNAIPLSQIDRTTLAADFNRVRAATDTLTSGLSAEDQNLQSMTDASPVKWHRAHTSWFFEAFILHHYSDQYRSLDPSFNYLFNSYYNGIGEQYPRSKRSLISRPDTHEVSAYRNHVDKAMIQLIEDCPKTSFDPLRHLIVLGLNHEQQHQELIVTDLKHAFAQNPLYPHWTSPPAGGGTAGKQGWRSFRGGVVHIGADGERFCFDNETPRHRVLVEDFEIADRPVTCGEFLAFIEDGGYDNPDLWLADGWDWVQNNHITAPEYWHRTDGGWHLYTLGGVREIDPDEALCHVSFYEAQAFAQWAGARLPTEAEWELAALTESLEGRFADSGHLHPTCAGSGSGLRQLFGDVWEWTASSYAAYPGFQTPEGAIGEYNGKFMANQMVLRGGSCATPAGHVRPTYRNFFYPGDRWQFSGIRLARTA